MEYTKDHNVALIVTADHGNCERMGTSESPDTAHTQYAVPCWLVKNGEVKTFSLLESDLTSIAPTILDIMEIPKPPVMTGLSLI